MSSTRLLIHALSARSGVMAALLMLLASITIASPARAEVEPSSRKVADLTVYVGIMPAEIVRGHPQFHPEGKMHGGAAGGAHEYHFVVAIFESSSGTRVEDAEVWATIEGLGHVSQNRVKLEPMVIAGTTTFGSFITLPGTDRYQIRVEIRRPNKAEPIETDFTVTHDTRDAEP